MKNNITHQEDIVLLVNSFYNTVNVDTAIGHIFNDVVNMNWKHHLPVMYDFLGERSFGWAFPFRKSDDKAYRAEQTVSFERRTF